jgi:hypothetical protein
MEHLSNVIFLGLALLIIPAAYVTVCLKMFRMYPAGPSRFCYFAYYILFGTVGGWCLAIGLSPSGLAALCIMFLMTIAPLACLVSSLVLQSRRTRTRYEEVAIIGGYSYLGLLVVWFLAVLIFALVTKA